MEHDNPDGRFSRIVRSLADFMYLMWSASSDSSGSATCVVKGSSVETITVSSHYPSNYEDIPSSVSSKGASSSGSDWFSTASMSVASRLS